MTECRGKMASMTGFGSVSPEGTGLAGRVEIKSVNNRGLKISVRSRPSLGVFERNLRELVGARLIRGSIDVYICFERVGPGRACSMRAGAAREAVAGLRRLAAELGLPDDLSARDLALIPGLFENSAEDPIAEEEWPGLEKAIMAALGQVVDMRLAEGAKLAEALLSLASPLEDFVRRTESAAPLALERSRVRLRQRLEDIRAGAMSQTDGQALEREMCLIADRADIREELDRLASHIGQYRTTLAAGGEAGKRMEFLAQEFLREINTIASKANDAEIAREAVEAKLTVEKIKEQSANLV